MATSTIHTSFYGDNLEHIGGGLFSAQDRNISVLDNVDLNSVTAHGNTYLVTNVTNNPSDTADDGRLFVIQTKYNDYNNVFQVYFPNFGKAYIRRRSWNSSQSDFTWTEWHSLW